MKGQRAERSGRSAPEPAVFADRAQAGRRLAERLGDLVGSDVVVLGLPRGGVPVAFEVAVELRAPLDVILVRKLGVPLQPELGMGALGEGGVRILDPRIVAAAGVCPEDLLAVERHESLVLDRQSRRWRHGNAPVPLVGRTVVVVDDGIATGATALAACRVARARGASRVLLAAPVAPAEAVRRLRREVDEIVVLRVPASFGSVGEWYADFTPTSDEQVESLLARANGGQASRRTSSGVSTAVRSGPGSTR